MSRNSNWFDLKSTTGPARWLKIGVLGLALLNLVALFLYVAPPGGSRRELRERQSALENNIRLRQMATERLKTVSAKVELGGEQTDKFSQQYFLPQRTAFAVLVGELFRLSSAAGLHEGQRTYTHEPIEGTDDLSLLTINANYQGSYADLMNFVNQVDHSDQLLILDTISATPQGQGTGVLNITSRFLAIVKDDGTPAPGAASVGGQP
jgi:Tfp pilus assembly protein PilO